MKNEEKEFEWMLRFHQEAWLQYSHEDNIMERRNSKFLYTQTILIGLIGASLSLIPLVFINNDLNKIEPLLFVAIYTSVVILISISALFLLNIWKKLNYVGKKYVELRYKTAKRIEDKIGFDISITNDEDKWKKSVNPINVPEGFLTTKQMIKVFEFLWVIICVFSFCSLMISLILLLFNNWFC